MDHHERREVAKCRDKLNDAIRLLDKLIEAAEAQEVNYGRWLLIRQIETAIMDVAGELGDMARRKEME